MVTVIWESLVIFPLYSPAVTFHLEWVRASSQSSFFSQHFWVSSQSLLQNPENLALVGSVYASAAATSTLAPPSTDLSLSLIAKCMVYLRRVVLSSSLQAPAPSLRSKPNHLQEKKEKWSEEILSWLLMVTVIDMCHQKVY